LAPRRAIAVDALRNGIVHGYETKTIRVGGADIELSVAWRTGRHQTFDSGQLILAVPDLADGLRGAFEDFEATLRGNADAREHFRERLRRGRVHEVRGPAEREAWQALLDDAT